MSINALHSSPTSDCEPADNTLGSPVVLCGFIDVSRKLFSLSN